IRSPSSRRAGGRSTTAPRRASCGNRDNKHRAHRAQFLRTNLVRPLLPRQSADAPVIASAGEMSADVNALTKRIIGAAIEVHRELGPGLLESTYEACLAFEFIERGLNFERQKPLPVIYRGHRLECGYRIDLFV